MKIVIDAEYTTLGRTSSYAAKQALLGHEVIIVNAEKAIIQGEPSMVADQYIAIRVKGGTSQKGPNFPSRPEFIFKRTIRGMLSYKQGRGREALKRIRCYVGIPHEFIEAKKISNKGNTTRRFITLEQLSHRLK